MKILVAASLLLLQSAAATQSIQGRVLRAGSERPVVRARVLVAPIVGSRNDPLATSISIESALAAGVSAAGNPGPRSSLKIGGDLKGVFTTMTDSNGSFSFTNLPVASYRLFVEHDDYVFTDYGVVERTKAEALVIPLVPTGVIFGRVVDPFGEPQAAFKVRAASNPEELQTDPVRESLSDDLGEFRLYGLSPGLYYVGAFPPPTPRLVT